MPILFPCMDLEQANLLLSFVEGLTQISFLLTPRLSQHILSPNRFPLKRFQIKWVYSGNGCKKILIRCSGSVLLFKGLYMLI